MNYDYSIKVILIGDMAVGKTSIMNVLLGNDFQYSYNATIGVDFGVQTYELTYKGYGYEFPINTENTEQGRLENRRTEIKIIGNL